MTAINYSSSVTVFAQRGLADLLRHAFESFVFYRDRFRECNVSLDQDEGTVLAAMKTLDELDLPILYAEALANREQHHFLTDQTSGTTGHPKTRYSSRRDDLAEADLCQGFFAGLGFDPNQDVVLSLDIDSADLYMFYGEALKALGIEHVFGSVCEDPASSIASFSGVAPTTILSTPSILRPVLQLAEGRQPLFPRLRRVISVGEAMPPSLRKSFNKRSIEVFSFYGATEVGSIAGECRAHAGLHILDGGLALTLRDTQHRPKGMIGLAEWTTCHFLDQPLLNYDTHDTVMVVTEPCVCGRSSARILDIRRRCDAFVLHGHTFWHSGFEQGLRVADVEPEFLQMIVSGHTMPHLVIRLPESLKTCASRIDRAVLARNDLGYFVERNLLTYEVEYATDPVGQGRKLRRVIDNRTAP